MAEQAIQLTIRISWSRPQGDHGPWCWGHKKDVRLDAAWAKRNVIYRWVKASTHEIAMIGETDRMLTERTDNYLCAKPDGQAGVTNKRLWQEHSHLEAHGDFLYLEFTEQVPGYDLGRQRERRLAEKLLIGVSRPYLQ